MSHPPQKPHGPVLTFMISIREYWAKNAYTFPRTVLDVLPVCVKKVACAICWRESPLCGHSSALRRIDENPEKNYITSQTGVPSSCHLLALESKYSLHTHMCIQYVQKEMQLIEENFTGIVKNGVHVSPLKCRPAWLIMLCNFQKRIFFSKECV
jgi:hypothetical protein